MAYPYDQPYQEQYYQPMQVGYMPQRQVRPQAAPQQSGVQWVSGELEAQSFLIAPNSAVALWDSTAPRVYLKQADASGRPTLKAYDLVERVETAPQAPQAPAVSYVTRIEFDELAAIVRELRAKKEKKRRVEENDEDE